MLVLRADGRSIETVVVAGRVRKANGHLSVWTSTNCAGT